MRHISEQGLEFIKSFEKFIPNVYNDGYGYLTIGYGHLIKSNEKFTTVSESEALEILSKDVEIAERAVLKYISMPLEDYQFDALVSLTFNAGAGALQRSRIRMLINRGDYEEAGEMFPKSFITSNGIKSKGLIRRRIGEQKIFLNI